MRRFIVYASAIPFAVLSDGFAVFAYVRAVLCAKTSDSSVETAKACCFAVLPAAFAVLLMLGLFGMSDRQIYLP
ncbi:hypothetical protein [Bifidobacterium canis]|uniref:hypothetical protein n=1 Tax=Bifidobacterium canis TaxID=2610880 RepID=UPI0012D99EFC|nr:hypothetical protein [Bifidobacterium canis]